MGNNFASNLTQYDPDGEYPSAGSPLDPEEQLKPRLVASKWAAWPAEQETANSPQPSAPPRMTGGSALTAADQVAAANADLTTAEQAANYQPDTSQLSALDTKILQEHRPTQMRENRPDGDMGVGTGKILHGGTDADGKPLPNFQASMGRRILRGLRGAGVGLALHGIPGALYGAISPGAEPGGKAYGAPNEKYDQAEADRTATLAYDEAARPAMTESLKSAIERRKFQATELNKSAEERNKGASELNSTPEAKGAAAGSEQTAKDAAMFADRQQLWPTVANLVPAAQRDAAQAHYLLTGEMPKPGEQRQATAEEINVARGVALKEKEKGGKLNYEEYMGVVRDASGRAGGGGQNEDVAQSLWAKAGGELEKFRAGFIQNPTTGRWRNNYTNKSMTNEEYVNAADQIRKSYNVKLSKMGYEIKPDGQLASTRAAGADASATAGTAVPSAPAAAAEPGIPISVARTFPVNKGKTDRQIIEHAASLGHTVIP
jgi:hypothetical protein